jgi:ribonuclease G
VSNELIIDVSKTEISIAQLEDKKLVELHTERREEGFSVGDIYIGRVRKLMPGLNAAFVDVGYEKDAFLHYLDLGPQYSSLSKFLTQATSRKPKSNPFYSMKMEHDIDKNGKIAAQLTPGQNILVQISKRAHFHQRTSFDIRNINCRTQYGTDAILRKDIRITKNRIKRGKKTT